MHGTGKSRRRGYKFVINMSQRDRRAAAWLSLAARALAPLFQHGPGIVLGTMPPDDTLIDPSTLCYTTLATAGLHPRVAAVLTPQKVLALIENMRTALTWLHYTPRLVETDAVANMRRMSSEALRVLYGDSCERIDALWNRASALSEIVVARLRPKVSLLHLNGWMDSIPLTYYVVKSSMRTDADLLPNYPAVLELVCQMSFWKDEVYDGRRLSDSNKPYTGLLWLLHQVYEPSAAPRSHESLVHIADRLPDRLLQLSIERHAQPVTLTLKWLRLL